MKDSYKKDSMLTGYLAAAIWAGLDEDRYTLDDIAYGSIMCASREIGRFVELAGSLLDSEDPSQVGHDFWLTRNGHGAGFWDGDYEDSKGRQLTAISKGFGTSDIYVRNNKIYLT